MAVVLKTKNWRTHFCIFLFLFLFIGDSIYSQGIENNENQSSMNWSEVNKESLREELMLELVLDKADQMDPDELASSLTKLAVIKENLNPNTNVTEGSWYADERKLLWNIYKGIEMTRHALVVGSSIAFTAIGKPELAGIVQTANSSAERLNELFFGKPLTAEDSPYLHTSDPENDKKEIVRELHQVSQENPDFKPYFEEFMNELDVKLDASLEEYASHFTETNELLTNLKNGQIDQSRLLNHLDDKINKMRNMISGFEEEIQTINGNITSIPRNILEGIGPQLESTLQKIEQEKQANQTKIKGIHSSISLLSKLGGMFDPDLERQIDIIGNSTYQLTSSLSQWRQNVDALKSLDDVNDFMAEGLGTAILTSNVIGIIGNISTLFQGRQPSAESMIFERLAALQQQIVHLGEMMNERFDRVDTSLSKIYDTITGEFAELDFEIDDIRTRLGEIESNLISFQKDVWRFEYDVLTGLRDGFRREFMENRTYILEDMIRNPDSSLISYQDFIDLYKNVYYYATLHAGDALETGNPARLTDLSRMEDDDVYQQFEVLPFHNNIDYLAAIAKHRFQVNNIPNPNTLANPMIWGKSVEPFIKLISVWPEHIPNVNEKSKRDIRNDIANLMQKGQDIKQFCRALTSISEANNYTTNPHFFQQLINNYKQRIQELDNAVSSYQQQYIYENLNERHEYTNYSFDLWYEASARNSNTLPTDYVPQLLPVEVADHDISLATLPFPLTASDIAQTKLIKYVLAEYLGMGQLKCVITDAKFQYQDYEKSNLYSYGGYAYQYTYKGNLQINYKIEFISNEGYTFQLVSDQFLSSNNVDYHHFVLSNSSLYPHRVEEITTINPYTYLQENWDTGVHLMDTFISHVTQSIVNNLSFYPTEITDLIDEATYTIQNLRPYHMPSSLPIDIADHSTQLQSIEFPLPFWDLQETDLYNHVMASACGMGQFKCLIREITFSNEEINVTRSLLTSNIHWIFDYNGNLTIGSDILFEDVHGNRYPIFSDQYIHPEQTHFHQYYFFPERRTMKEQVVLNHDPYEYTANNWKEGLLLSDAYKTHLAGMFLQKCALFPTDLQDSLSSELTSIRQQYNQKLGQDLQARFQNEAYRLSGAKRLLESYITLALPQVINYHDYLRGMLYGQDRLPDHTDLEAKLRSGFAGQFSTWCDYRIRALEKVLMDILSQIQYEIEPEYPIIDSILPYLAYVDVFVENQIQSQNTFNLGDVTKDTLITPADAQAAFELYIQIIAGARSPNPPFTTGSDEWLADYNQDGIVTPADAQAIFEQYIQILSQ